MRRGAAGRVGTSQLPDLVLAFVLLLTVGTPLVWSAVHHTAASGGSSGSSGSGSSGSSGGGSSGSSSSPTPTPTSTSASPAPSATSTSTAPRSSGAPSSSRAPATPTPSPRAEKAGDDFGTTVLALPPFVPLYCLIGAFGGTQGLPAGVPQQVGQDCSLVHVHGCSTGSGSGGSSNDGSSGGSSGTDSDCKKATLTPDTKLRIRVQDGGKVDVTAGIPDTTDNRTVLTLAVVGGVLILAVLLGLYLRWRRLRREAT